MRDRIMILVPLVWGIFLGVVLGRLSWDEARGGSGSSSGWVGFGWVRTIDLRTHSENFEFRCWSDRAWDDGSERDTKEQPGGDTDEADRIIPMEDSETVIDNDRKMDVMESELDRDQPEFVSLEQWKQQVLDDIGRSRENRAKIPVIVIERNDPFASKRRRLCRTPWLRMHRWTLGVCGMKPMRLKSSNTKAPLTGRQGGGDTARPGVLSPPPPGRNNEIEAEDGTTSWDSGQSNQFPPKGDEEIVEEQSESQYRKEQELFNFASVDAGARVVSANRGATGASNVISSDKDKYFLSPCQVPNGEGPNERWVVIEVSEDIIMSSIEVANYEFYSSPPRKIVVGGAKLYPPVSWKVLGEFPFENSHQNQRFDLGKTAIVRYLKVFFVGEQDSEYYCTISEIRIFGKRLIDDWDEALRSRETKYRAEAQELADFPAPKRFRRRRRITRPPIPPRASGLPPTRDSDSGSEFEFRRLLTIVASEALAPADSEESVFRRVTRMIRTLELNQSLTNRYIDTHLQKYASCLSAAKTDARVALHQMRELQGQVDRLSKIIRGDRPLQAHSSSAESLLSYIGIFSLGFLAFQAW
eukprot:CAMPEP_0184689268 /NCGR_PEP_ID=MMETSP0312-20130426/30562_1 /TAXON_ID=31354 /ORGANISM="Compsopogon coeruleus, Strain SAG 36.94" /LENGTH=583 /DNA_ID=CAMNT_0027146599 /DNA_START=11 /DNA_END=1759 /DNA_ORIENTATION=-